VDPFGDLFESRCTGESCHTATVVRHTRRPLEAPLITGPAAGCARAGTQRCAPGGTGGQHLARTAPTLNTGRPTVTGPDANCARTRTRQCVPAIPASRAGPGRTRPPLSSAGHHDRRQRHRLPGRQPPTHDPQLSQPQGGDPGSPSQTPAVPRPEPGRTLPAIPARGTGPGRPRPLPGSISGRGHRHQRRSHRRHLLRRRPPTHDPHHGPHHGPLLGGGPGHWGGLPCLRIGRSACLVASIARPRTSTARVSAGSMTSSTRPRSAA
jgi:hypothetical protein